MSAARKTDPFQLAFETFKAAHKSILDLDRKKLLPAKTAGNALKRMRQEKGCTIDQLLHMLDDLGIKISQDTHNRYVKVDSRWEEIVAIAKQRNIDVKKLGYMEALDLLPPSEHAEKVKAGKQRKKLATEPGSAPQQPPADWKGRVISFPGNQPAAQNVPQVVHKDSLSWLLRERWALTRADPDFEPPQQSEKDFTEAHLCFQHAKTAASTYATVALATGKDEKEVKRLLRGLDIDRADAEWAGFRRREDDLAATPETAAEGQQAKNEATLGHAQPIAQPTANGTPKQITYFHHDCQNFQIDGNSLQCLDQQGQIVTLVAPKQMADLLKDALADKPADSQIKEPNVYIDCHNFQVDGNSLQCLDQQGQTVVLVAPKRQRMARILTDALVDKSADSQIRLADKRDAGEATEKKPKGIKSKKPKQQPKQDHMNGRRDRK